MTDKWCENCGHLEHTLDACGQVDVDPDRDWATFICRCPLPKPVTERLKGYSHIPEVGDTVVIDYAYDLGLFLLIGIEHIDGHPVATLIPEAYPHSHQKALKVGLEFVYGNVKHD